MSRIESYNPFQQKARVQEIWLELQAHSPHSFFLSWGWVECWLKSIPHSTPVQCIVAFTLDKPITAFFLTKTTVIRSGIIRKRCAYINETGNEEVDDLTIEFNGTLDLGVKSGSTLLHEEPSFASVEEFNFSALAESAFRQLSFPPTDFTTLSKKIPSYFVDLNSVRQSDKSYLSMLSANRRGQIRRSLREYEKDGDVQLHRAASAEEALALLTELKNLHQKEWESRGKNGAFATVFFENFHRELIKSRFEHGEIDLLRFTNRAGTIGLIYSFIYKGEVLFYQSGFKYGKSNNERPGLVCHYLAIIYYLGKDCDKYNFLGGKANYKKSLSTGSDSIYDARVVRKNYKWRAEQFLRKLMRREIMSGEMS